MEKSNPLNLLIDGTQSVLKIAKLSWPQFLKMVADLNKRCQTQTDCDGKYVVFAIMKGSSDSYLWKATIKICCVKMTADRRVESRKLMSLSQFLRVYNALHYVQQSQASAATSASASHATSNLNQIDDIGASFIFNKIDAPQHCLKGDLEHECIICMERKPEVILPCAHTFCLPCIDQWNMGRKWCPLCHDKLMSTDDAWVIAEAPPQGDMTEYLLQIATDDQPHTSQQTSSTQLDS